MKIQVRITDFRTVNELDSYWTNADFVNLLKEMDFPDAEKSKPEELRELVYMALTDFEPNEAAAIVLTYKLGEKLTEGQIHSISHEMSNDRIAEEYPDPAFHYDLFNINQLLFKAFNGSFPNTEASIITLELNYDQATEINKEILLKAIGAGLSDRSLIQRLYPNQIKGEAPFVDASKILWRFKKVNDTEYEIVTSKYWIDKEDIEQAEYEAIIVFHQDPE